MTPPRHVQKYQPNFLDTERIMDTIRIRAITVVKRPKPNNMQWSAVEGRMQTLNYKKPLLTMKLMAT